MSVLRRAVLAICLAACASPASLAADKMTAEQLADARTKVEVATKLAAIGKAEKDGEMLAVAAKLLSQVGDPVAIPGEKPKDGKPMAYDIKALLGEAKAAGADVSKAEHAAMSMKQPLASCYWGYVCDSWSNTCQYMYICD